MAIAPKFKLKLGALIFAVTFASSIFYVTANRANALEVDVNGRPIAYVKDKGEVIASESTFEANLKKRFDSVTLEDSISYKAVRIDNKLLFKKSALDEAISKNLKGYVKGVTIKASGLEIGNAASIAEAKTILLQVRDFYINKSGIETGNLEDVTLEDSIIVADTKISFSSIKNVSDTVSDITSMTKNDGKFYLNFEIKGVKDKYLEQTYMNSSLIASKNLKPISVSEAPSATVLGNRTVSFTTPVIGRISSGFGMRWGKMHQGIDIAANYGVAIDAALSGKVIFAGWETGYGNIIKIDHGGQIETDYGHCSKITAAVGAYVQKGQKIGEVGSTGNSTGPHVHFEIRYKGVPQNPSKYIKVK